MNESGFWQWLRDKMRCYWDAERIENGLACGVPDVNYGVPSHQGWIELKWLKKFPVRKTTKVRIHHWTGVQKQWLLRRGKVSGNCWMMIRVEDEVFLFSYDQTMLVETWTKSEWRMNCRFYSTVGAFKAMPFFQLLEKGHKV
jgi:hypothetical protein